MAIMQDSAAPSFFSPTLADYIIYGEIRKVQTSIQDICTLKVRNKIEELENIAYAEQFTKVASFECLSRFKAGFSQPIVALNDKECCMSLLYITLWFSHWMKQIDLLKDLDSIVYSDQCLWQHPKEARRIFLYDDCQVEEQQLDDFFCALILISLKQQETLRRNSFHQFFCLPLPRWCCSQPDQGNHSRFSHRREVWGSNHLKHGIAVSCVQGWHSW